MRIYRKRFSREASVLTVKSLLFLFFLILFISNFQKKILDEKVLKDLIYFNQNERISLEKDLNTWLRISKFYPDYRDAYARLAFLYLKLGDKINAKKYFVDVKKIDPNWPSLEKFRL